MDKKTDFAREGANIHILEQGRDLGAALGCFYFQEYDHYGYITQRWIDTPRFDGQVPTLG